MIVVGIDVAKDKHDCVILNVDGSVLQKPFSVENSLDGFISLLERIESFESDFSKVKVGLEACGHYGYNLLGWLLNKGFEPVVFNPLLTCKFRDLSLRKTKTDKIDALTIADILLSKVDLKSYTDTSYHNTEFKSLVRYRFKQSNVRAKYRISVSRLVTILFPELLKLVPDIHSDCIYALFSEFPGASYIANANLLKLTSLLKKASRGRRGRDFAIKLRDAARNSIASVFPASSFELKNTIRFIAALNEDIKEIDVKLNEFLKEYNSPILGIKGLGPVMAAMLLAEIGDFKRFSSPDQLLAYAGLTPSIYQSGQAPPVFGHMVKRGSKFLRYALFTAAANVCMYDPVFKAYLQKKLSEHKHYYTAVSHAAKKLVRVMFALEKSGQPYVPRIV